MAKKKGFKIPGVSFSASRALGISKAKSNFARKTGIPTTKSGRQRKIGKLVTGGCLLPVLSFTSIFIACISLFVIML